MFHTDATTKALPTVTVQPEHACAPDAFDDVPGLAGMNAAFVADLLSDMTMHERCGFHLYRSVSGRTQNAMLRWRYQTFGEQTFQHIGILENLAAQLGLDPLYVSPAARATEKMATGLLESTFMLEGSIDILTQELVMLDAVLLAEARDHANWSGLATLVPMFPKVSSEVVQAAVDQVEAQEDEHLGWVKSTRTKMIGLQAKSSAASTAIAVTEDLMARVKNLFD